MGRFRPSYGGDAASLIGDAAAATGGGNPYLAAFTSVIGAIGSGFNYFGTKKAADAAVTTSRDATALGLEQIKLGRESLKTGTEQMRASHAFTEKVLNNIVPLLFGIAILGVGYKALSKVDFDEEEE